MTAKFIDFAKLKEEVSIEQVVTTMLALTLKPTGNQLRGPCPIHDGGDPRSFVVTPAKGLWFCFKGCGGGDMIRLVAKIKRIEQKEAAQLIAAHFGPVQSPRNCTVPGTVTVPQVPKGNDEAGRSLQPLGYLQPEHEAVQALGLTTEACMHFGAGFAPKGIMRGRLAIPIHDRAGTLLAYVGRTVKDESPALIFPNGFNPSEAIFNAHRIGDGELYLVRDPLNTLLAFQNGVENVVSFLSPITAQSLEMLAALMDEKRCETVELF